MERVLEKRIVMTVCDELGGIRNALQGRAIYLYPERLDRAEPISSNHQCYMSPAVSRVVTESELDAKGTCTRYLPHFTANRDFFGFSYCVHIDTTRCYGTHDGRANALAQTHSVCARPRN
jgi:hypothetical protein